MSQKHKSVVGVFSNHQDAENSVKELQKSGYDMKKLSVAGKDSHTEENVKPISSAAKSQDVRL